MKRDKIIYTIATGLLSLMMLGSAGMYFLRYEEVAKTFTRLGYPTYIIYPLATIKILGLVALWSNISRTLKEWAYAGFFFNFVLAASGHIIADDQGFAPAVVAILLTLTSYIFDKRIAARTA